MPCRCAKYSYARGNRCWAQVPEGEIHMLKLNRLIAFIAVIPCVAHAETEVPVTYLKQEVPLPPVLSNLDPIPEDNGLAGARLGLEDNLTTAKFLGHNYTLSFSIVPEGGDWLAAAKEALDSSQFIILDAPPSAQLAVADLPAAENAILFNASEYDMSLRNKECRSNLFHAIPSYSMRADALMQFLAYRRWSNLALITGNRHKDIAFAESLKRSATKFGLELENEKPWLSDADMRRNAAREVPLLTQDLNDHDILLISDELHDFGRYIAYNTWAPRPIGGSEGLQPVAWSRVVEQWGAVQLQNRFEELAARDMTSRDFAAWVAIRSLGEAVTRTGSNDPQMLREYMLSDNFELSGFKGRPLTFRHWNGQLRQPIPLVTERSVVAMAPLEGFLHQNTELDTLGIDEPESECKQFERR